MGPLSPQVQQNAGVYASQTRDDFSADDVEHYFNYMGMLATEVSLRMQCTSIELVIDSAL